MHHDDMNEELSPRVRRMLSEIQREEMPSEELEQRVLAQLREMALVRDRIELRLQPRRRRIAVPLPMAIAASAVLFFSGLAIGASGDVLIKPHGVDGALPADQGQAASPPSEVLLESSGNSKVTRVVRY